MGNEYIFFDPSLVAQFASFVTKHDLASQVRPDRIEGWVVRLAGELDDAQADLIEAEYDRLMVVQRDLLDATDGADANDILVVELALPGGRSCWVRVPAVLGRRLADHFSFEEIHQLVALVAAQALQPSDAPLCQKV